MKNRNILFLMLGLYLMLFIGCTIQEIEQENKNANATTNEEIKTQIETATNTIQNMKGLSFENMVINETTATKIKLDGNRIEVEGPGVNVDGNIATIITAGDYYLSGNLTNGQIIVDAGENNVTLILDNVSIQSNTSSPIYVKQAKNTVLYLADGSVNKIEDSANYVFANATDDEPDATIFSKDDLYIVGNGTLTVKANYNDAIKSKDDLGILGGTIVVQSVDDGIVGKDSVSLKNCVLTITAEGDGIKSTNTEDSSKGYIAIESGTFSITATSDGIQAETDLNISGGTFEIITGGGSAVSSNNSSNNQWGRWEQTLDENDTQSAKGMKAEKNLTIMGGTFQIDSSDDAIHCNQDIVISDGNITILSGDDGIHVDNALNITGGTITIEKSYEGLESSHMLIADGTISIISTDDGINVAGGNDGSSIGGRPGENRFSSSSNHTLTIQGGNIFVDATGDGLDANGSIYISGGNIEVAGPTNGGNGALDYDRECIITGGTIIAYGSSGMNQNPSSTSTQYIVSINGNYQKEDLIEIKVGNTTIYSCTLRKNCQSIILSTPILTTGTEYSLYQNDNEIKTFTISSIITTVGSNSRGNNGRDNPRGNLEAGEWNPEENDRRNLDDGMGEPIGKNRKEEKIFQ